MNRIGNILKNYTDTELAYLNKFQLKNYLPETQKKIKDFIFKTRDLNQNVLDDLITVNENNNFNDDKYRCPRCKSDKMRIDERACSVCGYVLPYSKDEKRQFREDILDFFDHLGDV